MIRHFEQRLLHERARTLRRLERAAPRRSRAGVESVTRDSRFSQHMADMGLAAQEEETGFLLANHGGEQLARIDEALRLLHTDPAQFFTCKSCTRAIEEPRLEFLPWTRQCAACARMAETN